MLTGLHFLLTYSCNFECDHCFLFSGPGAKGTFTISRVRDALQQARDTGTIENVCFEGGEPALYYHTMREGLRLAHEMGFKTGIVTNAYWAVSEEDAELWLSPLMEAGLDNLSVSDDDLHYGHEPDTPPKRALTAAEKLGIPTGALVTNKPRVEKNDESPQVCGGVMFRGRAVERLRQDLPGKPRDVFNECPHEDLADPGRVHVDPFGNIHLCQGLVMGNIFENPLSQLIKDYVPEKHPIVASLLEGGPSLLARISGMLCEDTYIDACHLCYEARKSLLDRFPEYLTPRQVYGL